MRSLFCSLSEKIARGHLKVHSWDKVKVDRAPEGERDMAEGIKRVEREFQIVKQSSSDIVDEEGEREINERLSNYLGANGLGF